MANKIIFACLAHLPTPPLSSFSSTLYTPLLTLPLLSSEWGADVEVNLLHTDYDTYAIVLHTATEKATGKRVTTMKLYSKSVNVDSIQHNSITNTDSRVSIHKESPLLSFAQQRNH